MFSLHFFKIILLFLLEHFPHQNSWSIWDSVLHAIFKASPVSLLNTRTTSLPRCVEKRSDPAAKTFFTPPWGMHIQFCSPHILQAGRIQLAKVWHAKDWHILFDLWNLQNVSNYSSAKTITPTCLISLWHFVKHIVIYFFFFFLLM